MSYEDDDSSSSSSKEPGRYAPCQIGKRMIPARDGEYVPYSEHKSAVTAAYLRGRKSKENDVQRAKDDASRDLTRCKDDKETAIKRLREDLDKEKDNKRRCEEDAKSAKKSGQHDSEAAHRLSSAERAELVELREKVRRLESERHTAEGSSTNYLGIIHKMLDMLGGK